MAAWICPTCRIHYGETQAGFCPADGTRLVLNLSGAQLLGNTLTHLLHVGHDSSTVWEAVTAQGARVALKLLRGPQDATAWSSAALLSHPRIVALRGYASIDDDLACVVMQWLEGRTLAETLAESPLPLPEALRLTDELLDALAYIHGRDLVHGDVHAETVFVERGEHIKLMDVGVHHARPLAEILGTGRRALDWYTVLYASPERLATGRSEPRSDLYAVGALLWHMCVGSPPFGIDPQSVARHHLTARRPRLAEARPDLPWPVGLQAALDQAMALRPEERFASAAAFRKALGAISAQSTTVPTPPPTVQTAVVPMVPARAPAEVAPPPLTPPPAARAPSLVGWVVVAAAVVAGAGLMWYLNTHGPDQSPSPALAGGAREPGQEVPVERVEATPVAPSSMAGGEPARPPVVTSADAMVVAAEPVVPEPVVPEPVAVESVAVVSAEPVAPATEPVAPATEPAVVAVAPTSEPPVAVRPVAPPTEAVAPPRRVAPPTEAVAVGEPRTPDGSRRLRTGALVGRVGRVIRSEARPTRGGSTESGRVVILGAQDGAGTDRPARVPLLER